MESINITELKNYSPELIQEYLEQLQEPRLEIVIDKESGIKEDSIAYYTFCVYAEAAYAADLLSFASESFGYYTPCPSVIEPFRFVVDLRDIPGVVKALHEIATGYCNTEDGNAHDEYFEKAQQYYLDTALDQRNSYVWGLLKTAGEAFMQYTNELADADENEEEDKPE